MPYASPFPLAASRNASRAIDLVMDSGKKLSADRLISMRDGAFVDETRLAGGATGNLGAVAGLGG